MGPQYTEGMASEEAIYYHLSKCNNDFIPPLEAKVNIQEYSTKIFQKSVTFEAWDGNIMIGLVAAYFNDPARQTGYITNVSIIGSYKGKGIASNLLYKCVDYARKNSFRNIYLEVARSNHYAINLYMKFGFHVYENKDFLVLMKLDI